MIELSKGWRGRERVHIVIPDTKSTDVVPYSIAEAIKRGTQDRCALDDCGREIQQTLADGSECWTLSNARLEV
jgi:hypothetical protein